MDLSRSLRFDSKREFLDAEVGVRLAPWYPDSGMLFAAWFASIDGCALFEVRTVSSEGLLLSCWEDAEDGKAGFIPGAEVDDSFCLFAGLDSAATVEEDADDADLGLALSFGFAFPLVVFAVAEDEALLEFRGFLVPKAVVAWWCFGAGGGVIEPLET